MVVMLWIMKQELQLVPFLSLLYLDLNDLVPI